MGSAAPVDVVERLLDSGAAALEELRIERRPAFACGLDLPEEHIVARDGGGVCVAGVLEEDVVSILQDFLGTGDTVVEILLVGLVGVDAEDDVPPADEFELRCTVVEACDLKNIANPVPVKTWAKKRTS